jgi:hypothetical protein
MANVARDIEQVISVVHKSQGKYGYLDKLYGSCKQERAVKNPLMSVD